MRFLLGLALVLTACSGDNRPNESTPRTASAPRGPDALMLRVPRSGGAARVTAYPIDTTVWSGSGIVPPLDRVLAFDPEAALIAVEDSGGSPLWLDLRDGNVITPSRRTVRGLVSVDGSAIYGVSADGAIARFTPSGNWVETLPLPTHAVLPRHDGTILALAGRGAAAHLWRLHPPESRLLDTLALPNANAVASVSSGDRVYVTVNGRSIVAVSGRTLEQGSTTDLGGQIAALAPTPSGDRLYVITDSAQSVAVIASTRDGVAGRIELPGPARDLRIDPFGRYLLVRPRTGDSVWVASVGTDRVLGTLRTPWRGDIPFVAPDGLVAVQSGEDIAFVDPASLREIRRTIYGASDFWYPFVWSGFRPRLATAAASDSDSTFVVDDTIPDSLTPSFAPGDSAKVGYTVAFAVLLDEKAARDQAANITAEGRSARVMTSMIANTTVYRIVMGPFATRDEADRVGKASGHAYYVRVGSP